jgi:hypothetical protein
MRYRSPMTVARNLPTAFLPFETWTLRQASPRLPLPAARLPGNPASGLTPPAAQMGNRSTAVGDCTEDQPSAQGAGVRSRGIHVLSCGYEAERGRYHLPGRWSRAQVASAVGRFDGSSPSAFPPGESLWTHIVGSTRGLSWPALPAALRGGHVGGNVRPASRRQWRQMGYSSGPRRVGSSMASPRESAELIPDPQTWQSASWAGD